ncbi:AF4/FMR2 family member 1-like [Diretmus argenteus]
MAANFGWERRTMTSQPSLYNEERNLLRIRAWEQRNQETSQDKELNPENVPLFGEPFKTNKGDELSSRIQRMLGSYEEENNPYPGLGSFSREPFSSSPHVTLSQSDQGQPNTDKSAKPPFHHYTQHTSTPTQKGPSNTSNHFSLRKSTVPAPPNHHGPLSTYSQASLNHSQGDQLSYSAHPQRTSEDPDLRECARLPQVLSALSPDAEPIPCLHSSNHGNTEPQDMENKDTFERHQQRGSPAHPSTTNASLLDPQQSPKDASMPQPNKGTTLPSQTFPPLLASKAPNVVMTQKPTAYVRPMDGQDQVICETPKLKPSPEPYVPLPKINKSNLAKLKILPQFLETRTNEAQCVEDILREMTHSWPPLLTAIHTPSNGDPFKSPFPAKEADHVPSAYPGDKHSSSPTAPSSISQQSSSSTVEAAHSSGVDSASSSDSESSSGSESDSESCTEERPQPLGRASTQTKTDVPAVTHGEWQLGNWIRSSQQNSSTESQSNAHASERPTQSSKATKGKVAHPTGEHKPHLYSLQNEFSDNRAKPQKGSEGPQKNYSHKSPSTSLKSTHTNSRKTSDHKHPSKAAKASFPEDPQPGLHVESVDVLATRDKDPSLTDRPKVKTKTGHSKNNGNKSCTKAEVRSKSAAKRSSFDKRKAESEPGSKVTLVLYGRCPSCGVKSPSPCSCLTPSPAPADQLPPTPTPPVKIRCSKVKTPGTVAQKGPKKPHRSVPPPVPQHSKPGVPAKASCDSQRPPGSLLVKINLSLLLRVPQVSRVPQAPRSSGKRPSTVQDEGGKEPFTPLIRTKTSKKRPAEADSKILPRKKQKLENESKITPPSQPSHASTKPPSCTAAAEKRERKKAKRDPVPLQQPPPTHHTAKGSEVHKPRPSETQESSVGAVKSRDTPVKHKKSTGKHSEHSNFGKQKAPKSSSAVPPPPTQPTGDTSTLRRPLLRFEDERQHLVKHYMKEAKKLKHKADAESDKITKAFNYLDAAMFFVESGIAMEVDPQTPTFSYTMFAETVELLKFVLKLKNTADPSSPPSDTDFIVLCMKCQSLLQMAMFRLKHKTALKYSKTLTDHFKNSKPAPEPLLCASKSTDAPSPMPDMPSPASVASSSGFGSNNSGGEAGGLVVSPASSTVVIPQVIQQVAVSYVNMTTLFLTAHDIWEQAEELAHRGSGLLSELDSAMGPMSLTSTIRSLVRYTRQGLHWLRVDCQRAQ